MNDSMKQVGAPVIRDARDQIARWLPGITGAVDGYRHPVQINGWIVKRLEDRFDTDLRLELRRGAAVIAQASPASPRRDVTHNDTTSAGFVVDCAGLATPEELVDGTITFFAVDLHGTSKQIYINEPVLEKVKETISAERLRSKIEQAVVDDARNQVLDPAKDDEPQNFDDFLAEFLASELFYPVVTDAEAVHLIGSVIDDQFVATTTADQGAKGPVQFWGCGLRRPGGLSADRRHRAKVLAVRGPLSAADLECDDAIPRVDPGLLLPALHTPRPAPVFQGRTVCIPHFHECRSDEELLLLSGCEMVLRPNIAKTFAAIRDFIDAVAAADFVLSAALQGAITAAAYHRPFAFWDYGDIDLPFTWADFAASVGIPVAFHVNVSAGRNHYDSAVGPAICIPSLLPLLAHAPFPVQPAALLKVVQQDTLSRRLAAPETHVVSMRSPDSRDPVAAISGAQRPSRLVGAIDRLDHRNISGWAVDLENPFRPVVLEILDNNEVLACIVAGDYRKDLAEAGWLGDGHHGFQFRRLQSLARVIDHSIRIRQKSDKKDLPGSPCFLEGEPAVFDKDSQRLFARMVIRTAETVTETDVLDRNIAFVIGQAEKILDARAKCRTGIGRGRRGGELRQRWVMTLMRHIQDRLSPTTETVRPHVLFIDEVLPILHHDAGSNAAIGHMCSLLRLGYQVTCIADNISTAKLGAARRLSDMGIDVLGPPEYEAVEDVFLTSGIYFDVVFIHKFSAAAKYLMMSREYLPHSRIIYSVADLHFLRAERRAGIEHDTCQATASAALKKDELAMAGMADLVITHSTHEARVLNEAVPETSVHVIPWPVDVSPRAAPLSERRGIAFIGGYLHAPNVDAAKWLVNEIMPHVWKLNKTIECYLVGSDMPDDLASMAGDGVVALGHVESLASVFNRVRLTVAPLRFGAGIKGKVLDSMAAGVPCVCTTIAAEGIALPSLLQRYVADEPEEIARLVCRLHADLDDNKLCGDAGMEFCRTELSEGRIDGLLKGVMGA